MALTEFTESLFSNLQTLLSPDEMPTQKRRKRTDKTSDPLSLRDYGVDPRVASAYATLFSQSISTRKAFLSEFNKYRNFYIVQTLLNSVVEDSLTPDATSGDILEIGSSNEKLNKKLKEFQEKINLDQVVNDIIIDLLSFGEYTLRVEVDSKEGVVDVIDDIDQSKIVAFYSEGFPSKFVRQTKRDLMVKEPYEFLHFVYGRNKLRVKLDQEFDDEERVKKLRDNEGNKFPVYARVGRPMLYGVLNKIKELSVLEALIPAWSLNQLISGSIVGYQIPNITDPEEGFKAAQKLESILNSQQAINRITGDISVAEIMSIAGSIRVIPQFGDRGGLQNLNDSKENRKADELMSSIRDVREIICTSAGFPIEILYGGETGRRGEFLKRYSRYVRKLKDIQYAISRGITQLSVNHLMNCGFTNVTVNDITVKFKNELVNIDELEKLEFSDALTNMISNINRFFSDLNQDEKTANMISIPSYHRYLFDTLQLLTQGYNIIKPPPEEGEEEPEPSSSDGDKDGEEPDSDQGSGNRGFGGRRGFGRQQQQQGQQQGREEPEEEGEEISENNRESS